MGISLNKEGHVPYRSSKPPDVPRKISRKAVSTPELVHASNPARGIEKKPKN
jgi:hypothetical protein